MKDEQVFYLVHIHTSEVDYYALRDSLGSARDEVLLHAQANWVGQFPGIEMPKSKDKVIDDYYQAVNGSTYFRIVDIESEGNWVMEETRLRDTKNTNVY